MRRIGLFLLAAIIALAAAATASARDAGSSTRLGCPRTQTYQPFTRWLDPFLYTQLPGGAFENGTPGWTLRGASVVGENEPFYVNNSDDSDALLLPAGASATSPAVCTSLAHPTIRFFAKGPVLGLLKVDVTYRTLLGLTVTQPAGVALGLGAWTPTLPMIYLGNVLASLGSDPMISYRFTAVSGTWRIDDIYVDPIASRCC